MVGTRRVRQHQLPEGTAWPCSTGGLERYAVIDVGTNSVKFHVGEHRPDDAWHTVVDRAEVTRLGEGMAAHGGDIQPAGAGPDAGCDRRHGRRGDGARGRPRSRRSARRDCARPTTATRSSTRSGGDCGITVRVITGDEESRLAYLAAIATTGSAGRARSWSSTRAGAARSSRSATARTSTSGSACPWAPCATRSGSGSRMPCRPEVLAEARAAIAADLARIDGRPGDRTTSSPWVAP